MVPKTKKEWHLNPSEVIRGQQGLTIGHRRKLRQSRAADLRGLIVSLQHISTGITIEATIPLGNYSRKELQKLRDELYQELFQKLEKQVAKQLGISGF